MTSWLPGVATLATLAIGVLCACGHPKMDRGTGSTDAGADAEPVVSPPACDGVVPACVPPIASYALEIAPLLNAKCNNCHSPEPEQPWPFDNYLNVVSWTLEISDSLAHCTMPPADGGTPSLTPTEHHAIANWLACDAPEN